MSDGIVLMGLPGSGKTSVGQRVAARLGRQFIDIDWEVERICGRNSADLIVSGGDGALRDVERQAVDQAVLNPGAVISTGGGTVLDPLNRWLLMEHGARVRLDAPAEMLASRLRADAGIRRPLLGGDLEAGLRRSSDERASFYAAVDAVVDATGELESVAVKVATVHEDAASGWRPLLDERAPRNHPIGPEYCRLLMGRGLDGATLSGAVKRAAQGAPAVVADRVALAANPAFAASLGTERICVIDGGEHVKTMTGLTDVLGWLSDIRAERGNPLIVVGGGTIGDLGGLAAALHRRGMSLINVPTTWLAQADSAIGGKVAVDLPNAKNGVGTFWPAWLIVEDADMLASLPVDRRRDGIAECLKAGLIGDPLLWQLIEERGVAALKGEDPAATYAMTERAIRIKLDIVDRDPFESGERRKLNLGHTVGHALEIESGYTLAHGAALALGLRAVARIAMRRGAQADLAARLDSTLNALGFDLRRSFDRTAVIAALGSDKKREGGVQRWILPMAVGEVVEVNDVTEAELNDALRTIAA